MIMSTTKGSVSQTGLLLLSVKPGLNADVLVDRPHQFYWCKVPKAASTSWISLLLSDREYANLETTIGRQHMYLR